MSTSQPLAALPSQLPYGATHVATAHAPLEQAGAAFVSVHVVPQAPQFAVFDCTSTHAAPQHVWPEGQACVALQPTTHALPTQSVPDGQWSSVRHSRQARVATLQ